MIFGAHIVKRGNFSGDSLTVVTLFKVQEEERDRVSHVLLTNRLYSGLVFRKPSGPAIFPVHSLEI
jgi:hypothetical protein